MGLHARPAAEADVSSRAKTGLGSASGPEPGDQRLDVTVNPVKASKNRTKNPP
jgi:hypothetical protein